MTFTTIAITVYRLVSNDNKKGWWSGLLNDVKLICYTYNNIYNNFQSLTWPISGVKSPTFCTRSTHHCGNLCQIRNLNYKKITSHKTNQQKGKIQTKKTSVHLHKSLKTNQIETNNLQSIPQKNIEIWYFGMISLLYSAKHTMILQQFILSTNQHNLSQTEFCVVSAIL